MEQSSAFVDVLCKLAFVRGYNASKIFGLGPDGNESGDPCMANVEVKRGGRIGRLWLKMTSGVMMEELTVCPVGSDAVEEDLLKRAERFRDDSESDCGSSRGHVGEGSKVANGRKKNGLVCLAYLDQVECGEREERKSETENGGLAFAESGEEAGAVLGGLASPVRESAAVVGKGGEHEGLQTLGRWLRGEQGEEAGGESGDGVVEGRRGEEEGTVVVHRTEMLCEHVQHVSRQFLQLHRLITCCRCDLAAKEKVYH